MSVAHIVVEIEEADKPSEEDFYIRMTYSGGNDLVNEKAIAAFEQIVEEITRVLNE